MIAPALHHRLSSLSIREPQIFQNFTVFPLVGESLTDPDFVMLKEALEKGFVTVEEIDESGSVPELEVVNNSDHFVLLLDGEEVAGAKQNRVLNTTILLDKKSRTRIPVSCTEQGRWAYNSDKFSHSGNIMSSKLRRRKSGSVSRSLKAKKSFLSDQGEVWDSIQEMHCLAGTSSATGAMKDAYESRQKDLEDYTGAIHQVENQVGLLVLIDGKPAGCDLFSRPESFATISEHLTRSYAMDAITSREKVSPGTVTVEDAESFVKELSELKEDAFDSVGVGRDLRYEGPHRNGSALLVEDTPIHAAFFSVEDDENERRRSSSSTRRGRSLMQRIRDDIEKEDEDS